MKPCIHIITLAVADLDRALTFYRDGLGFDTEGLIGTEFKGDERYIPTEPLRCSIWTVGLMLSIYPRSELAKDAVVPLTPAKPGEFSTRPCRGQPNRGGQVISRAEAAGAVVADPPHERPWGIYSGYFQDPDGHLWEIIWNPAIDAATA